MYRNYKPPIQIAPKKPAKGRKREQRRINVIVYLNSRKLAILSKPVVFRTLHELRILRLVYLKEEMPHLAGALDYEIGIYSEKVARSA